jgi:hypothetical protein
VSGFTLFDTRRALNRSRLYIEEAVGNVAQALALCLIGQAGVLFLFFYAISTLKARVEITSGKRIGSGWRFVNIAEPTSVPTLKHILVSNISDERKTWTSKKTDSCWLHWNGNGREAFDKFRWPDRPTRGRQPLIACPISTRVLDLNYPVALCHALLNTHSVYQGQAISPIADFERQVSDFVRQILGQRMKTSEVNIWQRELRWRSPRTRFQSRSFDEQVGLMDVERKLAGLRALVGDNSGIPLNPRSERDDRSLTPDNEQLPAGKESVRGSDHREGRADPKRGRIPVFVFGTLLFISGNFFIQYGAQRFENSCLIRGDGGIICL